MREIERVLERKRDKREMNRERRGRGDMRETVADYPLGAIDTHSEFHTSFKDESSCKKLDFQIS